MVPQSVLLRPGAVRAGLSLTSGHGAGEGESIDGIAECSCRDGSGSSMLNMFRSCSRTDEAVGMAPRQDARRSILDAARALIAEVQDPADITVRQIAQRAGVGTGSVNYHFTSKDHLLRLAIGDVMTSTVRAASHEGGASTGDPVSRLKTLVKELCALAGGSTQLARLILSHEVLGGDLQAGVHLVPLLRTIYGGSADETHLRILALQILHPIQVAGLNADAFHLYSGIDLSRPDQRDRFVDSLIDNLISPAMEGSSSP